MFDPESEKTHIEELPGVPSKCCHPVKSALGAKDLDLQLKISGLNPNLHLNLFESNEVHETILDQGLHHTYLASHSIPHSTLYLSNV